MSSLPNVTQAGRAPCSTSHASTIPTPSSQALVTLDDRIADGSSGVRITTRRGDPWISLPQIGKVTEAPNLAALMIGIERRWGTLVLLDVFEDADHLTTLTDQFATVGSREAIPRGSLIANRHTHCAVIGQHPYLIAAAMTLVSESSKARSRHPAATATWCS